MPSIEFNTTPWKEFFFKCQIKSFLLGTNIPVTLGTFKPDKKSSSLTFKGNLKRILTYLPLITISASFSHIGQQKRRQAAGTFITAGTNVPVRNRYIYTR